MSQAREEFKCHDLKDASKTKDTPRAYQNLNFCHSQLFTFLNGTLHPKLVHSYICSNNSISLFNLTDHQVLEFSAYQYKGLALTPLANQSIAAIDADGNIKIWDISNPDQIKSVRDISLPMSDKKMIEENRKLEHVQGSPFSLFPFSDKEHFLIAYCLDYYVVHKLFVVDSLQGTSFPFNNLNKLLADQFPLWNYETNTITLLDDGRIAIPARSPDHAQQDDIWETHLIELNWKIQNNKDLVFAVEPFNTFNSRQFFSIEDNKYFIFMATHGRYQLSKIPFSFTTKELNSIKVDGSPVAQLNSGEIVFVTYGEMVGLECTIKSYSILHPTGEITNKEFNVNTFIRVCSDLGVFFLQPPDNIEFVGDTNLLFPYVMNKEDALNTYLFPNLSNIVLEYSNGLNKQILNELKHQQAATKNIKESLSVQPKIKSELTAPLASINQDIVNLSAGSKNSFFTKVKSLLKSNKQQSKDQHKEIGGVKFHY